jgi:imidazolonepropionase-like amidohydrolase
MPAIVRQKASWKFALMFSQIKSQTSELDLCTQLSAASGPVWLRIGTLVNGIDSQPLYSAHLVYDDSTILHIGDETQTPAPEVLKPGQRAPDLDLPGFTAIPALIEAHAHLFLEGGELDLATRKLYLEKPANELLARAERRLRALVPVGVMAVRDAGDRHGVGLELSRKYREDRNGGFVAYIDSPGAAIHHKGRYGSFMAQPIEEFNCAEDCVANRIEAGAHRIKFLVSGIIDFKAGRVTSSPQMTLEEVRTFVGSVRARGRQSFAHASGAEGIENAIAGGVDSVEHGFFISGEQLAKLRDRDIAWVPTFAPVQAQLDHAGKMGWDETVTDHLRRILDDHARQLCLARVMGVRVIAGSDAGSCGVPHGSGLLHEMELMERAGMSSLAVINSATGASASRLGFEEPFGSIEPGRMARFILTAHNPLETVSNLVREKICIYDGVAIAASEVVSTDGM